jgi:hypothetical protein
METAAARLAETEAIERVERGAGEEVLGVLFRAGVAVASERAAFTSDEVRERAQVSLDEPRVLGATMKALARAGVIEPTEEYRRSGRARNNNRPMRVWHSRLVAAEVAA